MNFNNFNTNKIRFHFIENPEITLLNKTFESSKTTKNSQVNKKNIISLEQSKNHHKNNNKIIENFYKKKINASFAEKLNRKNTIKELNQRRTVHISNNRNYKNKFKTTKIITNNTDINKILINSSYIHSLNKKDQINNNSLKYIGITNLKECFNPLKDKRKSNKLNKIIKTNSICLKSKLSFLKNKINDNKKNYLSMGEPWKESFSEKKINLHLTEENKENSNNTNINNLSHIYCNNNKQIKYIKKKKFKFYEVDYDIGKKGSLTNDEYSLLIKKFNLLLEEKQFYKKKLCKVEKENKKLKDEIKMKNKICNENKFLKREVKVLRNKINELLKNNDNNNNILLNEKNNEIPFELIHSCTGGSLPTTERYIIKLEKENEELSNKLLRFRNLLKLKNKDN